jgi:DNA-binding response OmpR family regulator
VAGTSRHPIFSLCLVAHTIVVIEDEAPIADAVAARLRSEGFDVEIANDGLAGVDLVERIQPDLVVLDLMLPGIDGLEVCRRIQAKRHVPVVMLTARDDETDVLVGLGVGADDYITKPFSQREMVARIRTVLRRAERSSNSNSDVLRLGAITIDPLRRVVTRDGAAVHLTPIEFDLLHRLVRQPGAVLTREQLLGDVWGYRDASGARTVDSHVRAVRRKLGDDVIRTVHGIGYAAQPGDGE